MKTQKVNSLNEDFRASRKIRKFIRQNKGMINASELIAWGQAIVSLSLIPGKLAPTLISLLACTNKETGQSRATIKGLHAKMYELKEENMFTQDIPSQRTVKRHLQELAKILQPYFRVSSHKRGTLTYNTYYTKTEYITKEVVRGTPGQLIGKPARVLKGDKASNPKCAREINKPTDKGLEAKESHSTFENQRGPTCPSVTNNLPSAKSASEDLFFNSKQQALPTTSSSVSQLDDHVVEVNKKVECENTENVIKEDEVSNFKDIPHSAVPSAGATGSRERLHQQTKFLVEFLNVSEEKAGQILAWWSADQIKAVINYMKERHKHAPISDKAAYFDKIVGKIGVGEKSAPGPSRAQILQRAHEQIEATKMTLVDKMKSPDMQELARLFEELLPEHKLAVYERVAKENILAANARTLWGALACSGTAEIVLQAARDYGYI